MFLCNIHKTMHFSTYFLTYFHQTLDRPQFPVDLQLRFRSAWTLTFLLALLLVLELNFSYYVIS